MTTCPKCGQSVEVYNIGNGVTTGRFHVCTSKSPCTAHYACNCLKEKIAELEAKYESLEQNILNLVHPNLKIDNNAKLEATIKTYCEETSRIDIERNKLEAKITILRKAIEPFANLVNVFANAEYTEEAPRYGEIYYRRRDIENAKRAYEETT